jgi:hypothetical protein
MSYYSAPITFSVIAQAAGLTAPYSLAALSGKTMYDSGGNPTTLSLPVSLGTAIGKSFGAPPYLIIITATSGGNQGAPTGNATSRLQTIVANQVSYSYSGGMVVLLGFDASPYNIKDLSITYKNGTSGTVKTFYETANVDGNGSDYTSFTLSPSSPVNVTR